MDEFWNLRMLYYFVTTAEYKNMTKAANALFLTQPALSHQIQKMETDLNVTLFLRVKKGLELTEQGQIFYEECKKMLAAHDRFKTAIYSLGRQTVGSLSIGYSKASERYLINSNRLFLEQFPGVNIRTIRQSARSILEQVESLVLDAAFMHGEDLENAPPSVKKLFLYSLDYMLLVSRENPLSERDSVNFSELKDQFFVLPDRRIHPEKVNNFMKYCRDNGFEPKIRHHHYKLSDYIMEIATYPDTVSVLPYIEATSEERGNYVRYVPLEGYLATDDIYLAWNDHSQSAVLPLYIDSVRANIPA